MSADMRLPQTFYSMRYQWRLIIDPPMTGRANMEKDLELMEEVAGGECPPILRLYRWNPPALSLGYFQDENEVADLEACRRAGIDLVRRPTGGRAVLHYDELTYSIIVPEVHPFIDQGSVLETYRSISRGLVTALNLMGITALLTPEREGQAGLAPGSCFDTPSAYEIQVQGKKVIGSAQLRRDGILLQHGAILFRLPADLYRQVLKKSYRKGAAGLEIDLSEQAAGLLDLGYDVSYEKMTRALIKAFSLVIPAVFTSARTLLKS
ncbi:MAG: lipoate--protein ligase family protein [Firmicutes bacterium]|nr:lipoate--protein ligase family protein [Bacillota bacterium]